MLVGVVSWLVWSRPDVGLEVTAAPSSSLRTDTSRTRQLLHTCSMMYQHKKTLHVLVFSFFIKRQTRIGIQHIMKPCYLRGGRGGSRGLKMGSALMGNLIIDDCLPEFYKNKCSALAFQDSAYISFFLTNMSLSNNTKSLDKCIIRELCSHET